MHRMEVVQIIVAVAVTVTIVVKFSIPFNPSALKWLHFNFTIVATRQ